MKRVNQILTLAFLVEKLSCQTRAWLLVFSLRLLIHRKNISFQTKLTLGSVPLVSVLKRFDCLNHSTSFISKIAWWSLSTFSLVQSVCPLVLMARHTSDCFEASSSPVLFVFPLPLNSPHPPRLNPQHPSPCLNKKYTERRNWSNMYKKIILNLWKKFPAV